MAQRIRRGIALGAALLALAAAPASAAEFDPSTGTGSVEHQEAQNAFGVSDVDFQTYADQAFFRHRIRTSYDCPGGGHSSTRETTLVNDTLVTNPGGQITGFDLTGFSGDVTRNPGSDCGGTVRSTTETLTIDVPPTLESGASTVIWTP